MLDASRTINGSFGEMWESGKWVTQVYEVEATIDLEKADVKRSGTRWTAKKLVGVSGSGLFKGYKVTTEWITKIGQVLDDNKKEYVTSLIVKLDDPESFGAMRVELTGVTFDKIDLVKYSVGAIVEEEFPFTFTGATLLDQIVAQ